MRAQFDAPIPEFMVNNEPWPEPRVADFGSGPVLHGSGLGGRWNFIHSRVGNRKTRRAAKAKARHAAWKARKPCS